MPAALSLDETMLARFADLAVGFGANVRPGQAVAISAEIGKEALARACAERAYEAGAKYVEVSYFDPHVKRFRLLHASDEALDYVPPWLGARLLSLGEERAARISLTGPVEPHLFDDIDPARAGRDQLPFVREVAQVVNDRTTNWTILPCPTPGWARLVHPDASEEEAFDRLVSELVHVLRLDEDDPVAAWRGRVDATVDAARRLTERRFDALRFTGPGTDLTVGLLPSSTFIAARFETVDGIRHMPNVPSEEIFSTPDPARVDGVVRATKPLYLGGSIVEGLEVEFREGRVVRIDAERNAEVLRGYCARDEGAARLGEVALVDGQGRIGPLGTVFFDTLLDENAASHIALGSAYAFTLADPADHERMNRSQIHVDFMIGSPEVRVDGLPRDGGEPVPVLAAGEWRV
jgi:aminopeptidase